MEPESETRSTLAFFQAFFQLIFHGLGCVNDTRTSLVGCVHNNATNFKKEAVAGGTDTETNPRSPERSQRQFMAKFLRSDVGGMAMRENGWRFGRKRKANDDDEEDDPEDDKPPPTNPDGKRIRHPKICNCICLHRKACYEVQLCRRCQREVCETCWRVNTMHRTPNGGYDGLCHNHWEETSPTDDGSDDASPTDRPPSGHHGGPT